MKSIIGFAMIALLLSMGGVIASQKSAGLSSEQKEFQSLDENIQNLKEKVLKINHEMMLLEEKLVYPSNTQVSVFLSIEPNPKFSLDSIELKLGDKVVNKHIYTYRELQALQQGGVQRLHTSNLATGTHKLAISITGHTDTNSRIKRSSSFTVKKEVGPKLVEIHISETGSSKPVVKLKKWQ